MARRLLPLFFVLSIGLLPAPALAGPTNCLTGTDPVVAGDADDLAAVRALVDSACPCSSYDGVSDGQKRADYLKCAKPVYTAQVEAGNLRAKCAGTLKKMLSATTCGVNPATGSRPCISMAVADGRISCKIRATTKKDGVTPADKCVDSAKATTAACPGITHCIDAADTNGDLRIAAPGDDGECVSDPPPAGEVICQSLSPLPSGNCEVTAGTIGLVLVGDVLTPGTIYRGGQVVVNGSGIIVQAGCASGCTGNTDCENVVASATTVTCPDGAISPGLINTHDHLTFTQNSPASDSGERYEHRHDWRHGQNGHTQIFAPGSASADQVRWGELRHLMGGATSIAGSGGQAGFLRNIDSAVLQEGLGQPPAEFDTFPLGDSDGDRLVGTCAYDGGPVTPAVISAEDAYLAHVAEGIDGSAANEAICLGDANPTNDITLAQTSFTHGIAVPTASLAAMGANGTALIWSPRSNISLYGDTAMVTAAQRMGVQIALGTDWTPTGSMNLLREMQCAAAFDDLYLDDHFSSEDIWAMATSNAASVAAMDEVIGSIEAGKIADLAIFRQQSDEGYGAVVDAEPEDVLLVTRAGLVLYGDSSVVSTIPLTGSCDEVDVCGEMKRVCSLAETGKTYTQIELSAASFPAFFCTTPAGERTCTPSRGVSVNGSTTYTGAVTGSDLDGDGITTGDNCPNVFNPVRPMDGGVQADADSDGDGDACDPCPIDASMTTCSTVDPNDVDGDGTPNGTDNCPVTDNAGQEDIDADAKGDACDACPSYSNPGSAPCAATIYDIKDGSIAPGSSVAVINAIVTGVAPNGFFVQVKAGDADYVGPDYSGVWVEELAPTVAVGNRITLSSAIVQSSFGRITLGSASVTIVNGSVEPAPAPVVEDAADVATGGSRAAALEGVLVTVEDVVVTDVNPTAGAGDSPPTNEFVVDSVLRVNDLLYLASPFPIVPQVFDSITGVLELRNGDSKLEPRDAADLVLGPPVLIDFSPSLSFVDEGATDVATGPTPLTVTLSAAAPSDTFVAISSDDTNELTVTGGGVTVLAGNSSGTVLVSGIMQATEVELVATLDSVVLSADVRVVGASETPALVSFTPETATISPSASLTLTVELNIPAPPGGTLVSLALDPPAAGTIPADVLVPAGQISATFDYTDGGTDTSVTIDATLGLTTLTSTVTMQVPAGHLVVNEIDYDNIGTDGAEFVEIYNGSSSPVNLSGYLLVLANGATNTVYATHDLSSLGTLAAGQYAVVGSSSVSPPMSVPFLDLGLVANVIQNGSPDGAAIVDTNTSTLVDALSYEGAMTMVTVSGLGVVSFVEGTALPAMIADSNTAPGTLARLPNGSDTDDASTDWNFSTSPTPGTANVP